MDLKKENENLFLQNHLNKKSDFSFFSLYKNAQKDTIDYTLFFLFVNVANNPLIDDILAQVDIVDVINSYVPLKRSGSNFSG